MLNAESLELADAAWQAERGTPVAGNGLGELFMPLTGLIDVDSEKARLARELEKIRAEIQKVREKLENPNFTGKVPAAVLQEHQKRLLDWQSKEQQIVSASEALG